MRRGLTEWVVVTGLLVLAAAGATALWGEPIRAAFGLPPPAAARAAPPR